MIILTPETEYWLRLFIIISLALAVPLGITLMVLLFKMMFLLHSVSDFLKMARYELLPVIQEVRQLAEGIGGLAGSASDGFKKMRKTLALTGPHLERLAERLRRVTASLGEKIFSH